jgi:ATP-dependent helicase YprA (DUF1998 family)
VLRSSREKDFPHAHKPDQALAISVVRSDGKSHPCSILLTPEQRRRVTEPKSEGKPLRLHKQQEEVVRIAGRGDNYVLTTGTGSGKSLANIVQIVNQIL